MVGFDPYLSRFLLTPPRGGRPFTILSSMVSGLFLLTPPRGGRQGRYCRVGNRPYFYSRPRVGGDEQMAETQLDNLQDFYSRPRVGGDTVIGDVAEVQLVISTHAPAWGATTAKVLHQQPKIISTHAPAWGATRASKAPSINTADFYSRPRVGGDAVCGQGGEKAEISTHAPAWGATPYRRIRPPRGIFLLTPPRGGRRAATTPLMSPPLFLLTPPRGGRRPALQKSLMR